MTLNKKNLPELFRRYVCDLKKLIWHTCGTHVAFLLCAQTQKWYSYHMGMYVCGYLCM